MNFFCMLEKISQLHRLIEMEKTGNPDILAKGLGVSRSTLYRIIDELKSYNAPIEYSREKETFYYTKGYELNLHCSIRLIDDEIELKKITGGCHFFSSVSYLRRKEHIFVIE